MMRGNSEGSLQKKLVVAPGGLPTSQDFKLVSNLNYAKEVALDPNMEHAAITSFGPGLLPASLPSAIACVCGFCLVAHFEMNLRKNDGSVSLEIDRVGIVAALSELVMREGGSISTSRMMKVPSQICFPHLSVIYRSFAAFLSHALIYIHIAAIRLQLGSSFSVVLVVSAEKGRMDNLVQNLEMFSRATVHSTRTALLGQTIGVHRVDLPSGQDHSGLASNAKRKFSALLTVKRPDRPGIVFDVVKLVSDHNMNICNLTTELERNQDGSEFTLITGIHSTEMPNKQDLGELLEKIRDIVGGDVSLDLGTESKEI